MNLRGKTRELIQFNTQAAVPVINSTGGWGLIWTNPSRTLFRDSPNGMEFSSDYGNTVDYYVYGGSSLDRLVASYRQLSGTMPMLPVWALGYHQSRNRYHSDREVLDVARRMKDEKIPMGSIFVDYHHWGNTAQARSALMKRFSQMWMSCLIHCIGTTIRTWYLQCGRHSSRVPKITRS